MSEGFSGGCQCGAVRFRIEGALGRASICHCRMCQKAFGGFFGPLVSAKVSQVTWTRGAPAHFQSSNKVRRGFCAACGTPLTYEWSRSIHEFAIGAFDDPTRIRPVVQMAAEAAMPWFADLPTLPVKSGQEEVEMAAFYAAIVSHQHPDHDTETWPPEG